MEFESNSIHKFAKSYEDRYNEYCSILCGNNDEMFSIRERWSLYLEVSMNNSSSIREWYAYWNILRTYCEGLNVTFPKVVQVRVINVNYEKLSADISIINAQNDEELHSVDSLIEAVPLKDLYVVTSPENADLDTIANCLDQLRFFYHHLWWPWVDDEEDAANKSVHWITAHLENRLELYYDKLTGKMPYTSAKTIKRLMEKCKESFEMLQNIDDLPPELVDHKYSELNSMKVELNLWSIPDIRKLKIEEIKKGISGRSVLITLQENDAHDVETYLRRAQDTLSLKTLEGIPIKLVSSSFERCHLNYDTDDVIILTPGRYALNYMEYFDFPVSVEGMNSTRETVISDERSFWSIFQFLATRVCIENIAFHLKFSRTVFIIKRGTLVLNDVNFNNYHSIDTIAIQLHKNTKLIARRCRFSNFNTAIVCQRGAVVELDDCVFENNFSCLQFVEGVKLTLNNCDLRSTENTPFVCERYLGDDAQERTYQSLDHLSSIPGITISHVKLDDETIAVENA